MVWGFYVKLLKMITFNAPMKQLPKEKEFADAPQAHPNLILGSLQLAVWIFFHPTAWRNHVRRIDDKLRPDFSLAELKRSHWRHPGLRRLLVQAYLILPVIVAVFDMVLTREPISALLSQVAYSLIVGTTASVAVGIGGNLAFGLVSPVITLAFLNLLYLLNSEVANSFAPVINNALSLVVTYSFIGSIAVCVSKRSLTPSLRTCIRGIAAGALCFWIVSLASSIVLSTANFGETLFFFVLLVVIVSLPPAMSLGLAVGWELKKWRRGIIIGIGIAFFLTGMGIMTFGTGMVNFEVMGGRGYQTAFLVLSATGKAIAFALPFVVGRQIGGTIAGVGAFVLCGVLQRILAVIFDPMTGAIAFDWQTLLISLLAINLGLTQTKWRSLLLYPLMVAWNFLSISRLQLNSAFWDEFQWLPLLGLEEQLVVNAENKPREARAAIAYLMNTPQKEAARSAKIELILRDLESCNNLEAIARAYHQCNLDELTIETPVCLEKLSAISRQVEAVLDRDGKDGLNAVVESLASLGREMDEKGDRLASRCQGIVDSWGEIIGN